MLFVFTVSAVVHEYILAICFGFFYPVLFCLFMCFGSKRKELSTPHYTHTGDMLENSATKYHHSVCVYDMLTPSSSFLTLLLVMFNFILHDQRKGAVWNIIMWTSLFLGQGVIICLYSQEWYAQRYCPLKEVTPTALLYALWRNVAPPT